MNWLLGWATRSINYLLILTVWTGFLHGTRWLVYNNLLVWQFGWLDLCLSAAELRHQQAIKFCCLININIQVEDGSLDRVSEVIRLGAYESAQYCLSLLNKDGAHTFRLQSVVNPNLAQDGNSGRDETHRIIV